MLLLSDGCKRHSRGKEASRCKLLSFGGKRGMPWFVSWNNSVLQSGYLCGKVYLDAQELNSDVSSQNNHWSPVESTRISKKV